MSHSSKITTCTKAQPWHHGKTTPPYRAETPLALILMTTREMHDQSCFGIHNFPRKNFDR